MKLTEFKKPVNESLNSWIGDLAASGIKGYFSGKGTKQQMIEDLFVKDFADDAFTSLMTAIKTGVVDPNLDSAVQKKKASRKRNSTASKLKKAAAPPAQPAAPVAPTSPTASPPAGQIVPESSYSELDALFESIIAEATSPGKQSITDFMNDWFNLYMSGIDWTANPQKAHRVKEVISSIESTYRDSKGSKGKVKKVIELLGTLAFTISKSSPRIPAGMKDEIQKLKAKSGGQSSQGAAPNNPNAPAASAAPAPAAAPTLASVKASIQSLANSDPQAYAQLIGSILKSVGAQKTSP